jgi:hypothetical protein
VVKEVGRGCLGGHGVKVAFEDPWELPGFCAWEYSQITPSE